MLITCCAKPVISMRRDLNSRNTRTKRQTRKIRTIRIKSVALSPTIPDAASDVRRISIYIEKTMKTSNMFIASNRNRNFIKPSKHENDNKDFDWLWLFVSHFFIVLWKNSVSKTIVFIRFWQRKCWPNSIWVKNWCSNVPICTICKIVPIWNHYLPAHQFQWKTWR